MLRMPELVQGLLNLRRQECWNVGGFRASDMRLLRPVLALITCFLTFEYFHLISINAHIIVSGRRHLLLATHCNSANASPR